MSRSLTLYDACPDQLRQDGEAPYYATDPVCCGVFPSAALAACLRQLPQLRSLRIHKRELVTHGVTWDTLLAILSVPNLQELKFTGMYICPFSHSGDDLCIDAHALAPITTFHYQILDSPKAVGFETEAAALAAVLTGLHEGLETLTLTSESAPLPTLAQLDWPCLRKLTFYGTPWEAPTPAIAASSTKMPHLRELSFKLYTPSQANVPRIYDGVHLPPHLVRLALSAPIPQDDVFDHLPVTLRALSLRYWPHLYVQQYLHDIGFIYSHPRYDLLLRSSDILNILRRCSTLSLDHLEIEYRADEEDHALLRYLAQTFPNITSLKIHRYHSTPGECNLSIVSWAAPPVEATAY